MRFKKSKVVVSEEICVRNGLIMEGYREFRIIHSEDVGIDAKV